MTKLWKCLHHNLMLAVVQYYIFPRTNPSNINLSFCINELNRNLSMKENKETGLLLTCWSEQYQFFFKFNLLIKTFKVFFSCWNLFSHNMAIVVKLNYTFRITVIFIGNWQLMLKILAVNIEVKLVRNMSLFIIKKYICCYVA